MGNCFAPQSGDFEVEEEKFDFMSPHVHVVPNKEIWDQKISEAKQDKKIVIANFSASWCGPCKLMAPLYSELSEKFPSLIFLMIDVDELTEFSASFDIRATPTFFFLRDGEQIDKLVGANKSELEKKIATHAADSSC